MIDVLISNWDSALVVIAFIATIAILLNRGAKKRASKMMLFLVTEAEIAFGGGTGDIKYSAVVSWLYGNMPAILQVLLTEKQLDDLIEDGVEELKRYLEKNTQARNFVLDK